MDNKEKVNALIEKQTIIIDFIKSVNKWSKDNYSDFIALLSEQADIEYKAFHSKLILADNVIGYQVPLLRSIAKAILKGDYNSFLHFCGYDYYEENMLYGLVVLNIKESTEDKIKNLDKYISRISNWALCDIISCEYKNNKDIYYSYLLTSLENPNVWKIRFGITGLMVNFIRSDKINEIIDKIFLIKADSYYVNMAIAWFLATLFTVDKNLTLKILQNKLKNAVILKMTLRKISDSYRVSKEDKASLKNFFKC
jgi:3-methyladenine DNA glycosylase AlkD